MQAVRIHTYPSRVSPTRFAFQVPNGVLSVLPGPGVTTGKELVSHPLIRKVDITVAHTVLTTWHDSNRILRQVLIQGAH